MKEPFHKVIGDKLLVSPVGINSHMRAVRAAEVMLLLEILMKSKMPPAAAREIAKLNEHLPGMLRSAEQKTVAKYADEVLADLAGREDETTSQPGPYSQKSSGRPSLATSYPGDSCSPEDPS